MWIFRFVLWLNGCDHACVEEPKRRPNKEVVKLRTSKKTKKGTNTKDRVKFRIHKQVTDLFRALDVVKRITSIAIEPGAYKFFVLCIVGTNTKDRVKFRIHKQVTDLFSAFDVVKQITSITIEPGIEDKYNTSES
ncbi:hypothetical protein F2Q68_00041632 [Brassica cretica]|uniref:Ribosomal protein S10 domain-containing protein n=1 Tax=Brassica cretica TaxID=69181 RepID=A0A8S9MJJ0_BRACR|nr:hypothetical protein F2Q68_00041632 [Brassica cretica]